MITQPGACPRWVHPPFSRPFPPPSPRLPQVKAWVYYEARLLGAHHGLLSTYALETMVLAVINRHHAARPFTCPLQVSRRVGGGGRFVVIDRMRMLPIAGAQQQ